MKKIIPIILLAVIFSACGKGKSEAEDFSLFIEKFYSDSAFAVTRMDTVMGYHPYEQLSDGIPDNERYKYQWPIEELKKEWSLFNGIRSDKNCVRDQSIEGIKAKGSIGIPDSCISIELLFHLKDNKWYLDGCDIDAI